MQFRPDGPSGSGAGATECEPTRARLAPPRKAGANQWVIASKHEIVLPFDEANERGNLFERREQQQQAEAVTAVRECDIGDANP